MINDGNHAYNPGNGIGDSSSPVESTGISPAPLDLIVAARVGRFHRSRTVTDTAQSLFSNLLGQRVGYLEIDPFAHRSVLGALPKRFFDPSNVIPCNNVLCVIERGDVRIVHPVYQYCVKTLDLRVPSSRLTFRW